MSIKVGQRVHFSFDPEKKGTVSKVAGDQFRVTWDDSERPSGRPRTRFWYGKEALMTIRPW